MISRRTRRRTCHERFSRDVTWITVVVKSRASNGVVDRLAPLEMKCFPQRVNTDYPAFANPHAFSLITTHKKELIER